MRGKLILVAGIATGYVLGSRAGRERYTQISNVAGKLWKSRVVQGQVHKVEDFAADKTPDVVDFVAKNVKKVMFPKSRTPRTTGTTSPTSL